MNISLIPIQSFLISLIQKFFNYLGKHEGAIGSSYLEIDGKNLLLGSGNGDFAFMGN